MAWLALSFGLLIGVALGLTGGGGSIFAVPLLVYGLDVPAREAVTISLAAVGLTALAGVVQRWRAGLVEIRTGLLFAVAGMLGAPLGAWLAGLLPDPVLLTLFALLMLIVAVRMWRKAGVAAAAAGMTSDGPACRRDPQGQLQLTSRCTLLLTVVGVGSGFLSGLFGVGGGFVIVPALVFFSGMGMHRAVSTSLLVIALVSAAGLTSHLWAGRNCSPELVGLFAGGGVGGMVLGTGLVRRLSGPVLQRGFAVAMLGVAGLLIVRNVA
jgi:uncharacterized membrane protein YfcA